MFAGEFAESAVESHQSQTCHLSKSRQVGVRPLSRCELLHRGQGSELAFNVVGVWLRIENYARITREQIVGFLGANLGLHFMAHHGGVCQ
jgi:hypothetical protein